MTENNRTGCPAARELLPDAVDYPAAVARWPSRLFVRGNAGLLQRRLIGLFSSIKCPASAILRAFDWAKNVPREGVAIISGFHSPIEQECLGILLRREAPVVICAAREIAAYRWPTAWDASLEAGRAALLSPFEGQRRPTRATAKLRNELVMRLASELVVVYAATGSETSLLVEAAGSAGKAVEMLYP